MARKSRMEFEGAIYHVMNRGDRKELTFRDESDRFLFLERLRRACARTGWPVHAFCLMSNVLGVFSNQMILVSDQFYDTNTFEFTTNTFQLRTIHL